VNKKMPNNFIAREKPLVKTSFSPFTIENLSNKKYNKLSKMSKKAPNKVVTKLEEGQEEDSPLEFQDGVLACLSDLQHLAVSIGEKARQMEFEIRQFRTSIHGEDVDK
jgi:hypothetical protein